MKVLYKSTRGRDKGVTASEAILRGLASDGGLFVPDEIPSLTTSFEELAKLSYKELAYVVMSKFFTDYTKGELWSCIENAYDSKFDTDVIAPLKKTKDATFLELFHGRTIAFKDMALSILPYLMTTAAKKNDLKAEIVILTATSGDTGKAALEAFADVRGTRIIVFYPKDGVSPVQELQMVTQKGDNTCVIAVKGNFDDAQSGVKKMFADAALNDDVKRAGYQFSSANSINIGRLVPQIVYYVYAYAQLIKSGEIGSGEKINFVVPTGNFGNILAAYYAKLMGLPVNRLVCASNKNKVLFDFFGTGVYDKNREFYVTSSPSMDILVSSNLERLIYRIAGDDTAATAKWMKELSEQGRYELSNEHRSRLSDFASGFANEDECAAAIKKLYVEDDYVIDPHTAVAAAVYEKYRSSTLDETKTVIVSTASPYKFTRSVLEAIGGKTYEKHTDVEQFDDLAALSKISEPAAIRELRSAKVRHEKVVGVADMQNAVRKELALRTF